MNKKKHTLDYLSHTQNTSPAKLSFSFSKTVRFPQNISYACYKLVNRQASFMRNQKSDRGGQLQWATEKKLKWKIKIQATLASMISKDHLTLVQRIEGKE